MADPKTPDGEMNPSPETPPPPEAAPPVPAPVSDPIEELNIRYPPGWRQRRALKVTLVFAALWLLMVLFVRSGAPPIVFLLLLSPVYGLVLLIALRTPRALRASRSKRPLGERLTFGNRLTIAILLFVGIFVPFTFFSNEVIPLAPLVEFAVLIGLISLL